MSKTKQITLYRFEELSASAKEKAKQDYASACGYSWGDEALESIKALAAHFGGRMKNWSISWDNCSYSSADFRMPEMDEEEIAELLGQLGAFNPETGRGLGDCKLTGYCADEDAIDGFRAAWNRGERDLEALMESGFRSWLKASQEDYKSQFEDEQFTEHCEANDYWFHASGELE